MVLKYLNTLFYTLSLSVATFSSLAVAMENDNTRNCDESVNKFLKEQSKATCFGEEASASLIAFKNMKVQEVAKAVECVGRDPKAQIVSNVLVKCQSENPSCKNEWNFNIKSTEENSSRYSQIKIIRDSADRIVSIRFSYNDKDPSLKRSVTYEDNSELKFNYDEQGECKLVDKLSVFINQKEYYPSLEICKMAAKTFGSLFNTNNLNNYIHSEAFDTPLNNSDLKPKDCKFNHSAGQLPSYIRQNVLSEEKLNLINIESLNKELESESEKKGRKIGFGEDFRGNLCSVIRSKEKPEAIEKIEIVTATRRRFTEMLNYFKEGCKDYVPFMNEERKGSGNKTQSYDVGNSEVR